jgi:hypothetical protein
VYPSSAKSVFTRSRVQVLGHHVERDELDGARGGEVTIFDEVGALEGVHLLDRLGDQEVQVGVALAVGVRAQVHRHAVHEERDVGAVIGVEPPQHVLLGLAPALVLAHDQAGHQPEDVGRPAVGQQLEVLTGDQQLRGRRHRRRRRHHDRRQQGVGDGPRLGFLRGGAGHRGRHERRAQDEGAEPEARCRYEHCAVPHTTESRVTKGPRS